MDGWMERGMGKKREGGMNKWIGKGRNGEGWMDGWMDGWKSG